MSNEAQTHTAKDIPWDTPEWWNTQYESDPGAGDIPDSIVEQIAGSLTPGSALDLGCGSGGRALALAATGWRVLGVDWAEAAVQHARSAAQTGGLAARFEVGDTTTWKPAEHYDLVFSTYALPGKEGSAQLLHTARDALAPGGTLVIVEWHREMASAWGFAPEDLSTPESIAAELTGLQLQRCERVETSASFPDPEQPGSERAMPAVISVVQATRPAQPALLGPTQACGPGG